MLELRDVPAVVSVRMALASTAAGKFGFGIMSYDVCPCSVTAIPSKPERIPSNNSSMNQRYESNIASGSTSSYGVETTDDMP